MPAALLPVLQVHRQRRPDHGAAGELKVRRHDADHGVELVIQLHRLAQHIAAAREAALPDSMTQDDDVVRSQLHLLRGEGPAQRGLAAQHIEEIERDARAVQPLRLAAARQIEPLIAERGDRREGVVLIAEAEIISRREGELRKSGLEISLANDHELLGSVESQRLEQHGVDHREDGRIRADSQRQGEHRNAGEPRIAAQGAESIAEIPKYRRKHGYGVGRRGGVRR